MGEFLRVKKNNAKVSRAMEAAFSTAGETKMAWETRSASPKFTTRRGRIRSQFGRVRTNYVVVRLKRSKILEAKVPGRQECDTSQRRSDDLLGTRRQRLSQLVSSST